VSYSVQDITVIITCYKEGELLRRAMASVKAQTVQGFFIILVNDCSPDALTNSICEELAKTPAVKYMRLEKNGGSAVARNAAINNCTTDLIVPLDGDDELSVNVISVALKYFNLRPNADFLFGDYMIKVPETESSMLVSCAHLADDSGLLSGEALARDWILLGQSPYKREVWEKVKGFKEEFSHTYEDLVFWRDAIMAGMQGLYVKQVIYTWHRSERGKNASLDEHAFLPVRIHGLPFYDRFYPSYGHEIRQYIYRYYSARLMASELNAFLKLHHQNAFNRLQKFKARLMYIKPLYVLLRQIANLNRSAA
jgi:glycosyltransferase involved in cell wall biosynthesis